MQSPMLGTAYAVRNKNIHIQSLPSWNLPYSVIEKNRHDTKKKKKNTQQIYNHSFDKMRETSEWC